MEMGVQVASYKDLVVLANSRKPPSGRCVAGKVHSGRETGNWIRPVSGRDSLEVSEFERRYADGRDPKVLDIVRVPLLVPQPGCHQTENWTIDTSEHWQKVGDFPASQLETLVDPAAELWGPDGSRSFHNINDRLTHQQADIFATSLCFIRVPELQLVVLDASEYGGGTRRRIQGTFVYKNEFYRLWVTDPVIERQYFDGPNGTFDIGEAFLTVSMTDPFGQNAYCYRLIASILSAG